MAYFSKHLGDGERVILVGRPTWWSVGYPLAAGAVIALVIGIAASLVPGGLSPTSSSGPWVAFLLQTAVAVPLLGGIFYAVPRAVRLVTTEIVLTDRRVASKTGVFSIDVISTPLDKVNNINVQQGVLGRVLDYGTIEVTTATAEEKDNHTVKFLAHANTFRNEVNEAIDAGV